MKLLLTAAVILSLTLVVGCRESKQAGTVTFEAVPSVSFPSSIVSTRVAATTTNVVGDKCPWANAPYDGDTKILAEGPGFQIFCGKTSGYVGVKVDKTVTIDMYRSSTKVAIDASLCDLFGSEEAIRQHVSWPLTSTFELSQLQPSDEQPNCPPHGK